MTDQIKQILSSVFKFLGILDDQQQMSITNITVIVFLSITAFRSLFGGLDINIHDQIKWTVQTIDFASTLPLLFALMNYSHRRMEMNKTNNQPLEKENQ